MAEPTDREVRTDGRPATDMLATSAKTTWIWGVALREEVEAGLRILDDPYERFHLVEGPVERTIPDRAPPQIALPRLDTDEHESTRHELEHLNHRLVRGAAPRQGAGAALGRLGVSIVERALHPHDPTGICDTTRFYGETFGIAVAADEGIRTHHDAFVHASTSSAAVLTLGQRRWQLSLKNANYG